MATKPKKKAGESNADFANRLISGAKGKTNFTKTNQKLTVKAPKTKTSKSTRSVSKKSPSSSNLAPDELTSTKTAKSTQTIKDTIKKEEIKQPKDTPLVSGLVNAGKTLLDPWQEINDNLKNKGIGPGNVKAVGEAIISSSDTVTANIPGLTETGEGLVGAAANNPLITALGLSGIKGIITAGRSLIGLGGKTAVQQLATVGTTGLTTKTLTGGTAATFAVNTATTAVSAGMLATAAATTVANPVAVASATMAAIGTYPFSGFLKEEALQTLGFATKTAIEIGDEEGYKAAIALQKMLLDPDYEAKIKAAVPFANVLSELDAFFEAARIKVAIDEKLWDYRQDQINNGLTDADMFAKARQEQFEMDLAVQKAYEDGREKERIAEEEFRARERDLVNQDDIRDKELEAEFRARERQLSREEEAKDREAIAAFWKEFNKEKAKAQQDSRPSNLNFGLV